MAYLNVLEQILTHTIQILSFSLNNKKAALILVFVKDWTELFTLCIVNGFALGVVVKVYLQTRELRQLT